MRYEGIHCWIFIDPLTRLIWDGNGKRGDRLRGIQFANRKDDIGGNGINMLEKALPGALSYAGVDP